MPYVRRDENGDVTGVFNVKQPRVAEEFLTDTDPEVVAFRTPPPPLTPRQQIINKLRADPIFKAGILDGFEARGITDRDLILDALEAKFADTRI